MDLKTLSTVDKTSTKGCQVLTSCSAWSATFAIPLSGLLFFFRIRAVFHNSKTVVLLFALLWVAVLGCCIPASFGVEAAYVGSIGSCSDVSIAKSVSIGPIASCIYDTFVFIAISTKLMACSLSNRATWAERFRCFWVGPEGGPIMRTVLQTGQLYYL